MNPIYFKKISNKYKKCPMCNASNKADDMSISLEDDVVTVSCKCGWIKKCLITTHGTIIDLN